MRSKTESQEKLKHATRNNQKRTLFHSDLESILVTFIRKRQNVIELMHTAEPCRYFELHEVPQLLKLK